LKFQVISDLHLEYKQNLLYCDTFLTSCCDTLLVAGDLCNLNSACHKEWLRDILLTRWKHVIVTPGNHDYWGLHLSDSRMHRMCDLYNLFDGKIQWLHNSHIDLDNVRIIGTTLWSNLVMKSLFSSFSDIVKIHGFTVDEFNKLHTECVNYLRQALSDVPSGMRVIVLTHHLPCWSLVDLVYIRDRFSEAWACTDMNDLLLEYGDIIDYWVYGHSHEFRDDSFYNIRFIRNPLGYVGLGQQNTFKKSFVIKI